MTTLITRLWARLCSAARRLWPAPGMSLLLALAWLMLNGSASAGQCLLAAALGWAVPLALSALQTPHPAGATRRHAVRRWRTALALAATVLWDIVKSNLQVARLILGPSARIQPRFVWLPLTLRHPHGVVTLASIITMTPGTLSADLSDDRRHLLIHALDCASDDAAAALVAEVKARYEAPLIQIFEDGPA